MGTSQRICFSDCWLSFAAHPAQEDSAVSFTVGSRDMDFHLATPTQCSLDAAGGEFGGEGRNRTCLPARGAGTTVLKTATATRHASLSVGITAKRKCEGRGGAVRQTSAHLLDRLDDLSEVRKFSRLKLGINLLPINNDLKRAARARS